MNLIWGDCLEMMKDFPDDYVDLVFCSPPYESARSYEGLPALEGDAWVEWSVERFMECQRVCKGLVAWVVEGRTKNYQWSATPALLMAELHRRGVKLRKPPIFHRVGIPGSGGPDWWRNDYELIVCSSKGKLPWSDNLAMGNPPKYKPGGSMSHRTAKDNRVVKREYTPPKVCNPGNVLKCVVGGGRMGDELAHENEAPFPESLAESFIRSFCPPKGIVLDPFVGSGTTLAVAKKWGRYGIGIDVRSSQIELSMRRLSKISGD